MVSVAIKNSDGKDSGNLELNDAVFGVEPNLNCIRQLVNCTRANQRQGTHATKNRSIVRGGGKKPWKQKGTGRARAGSSRSPIWRGGGTVFGPQPRDYTQKINRKVKFSAYRSLWSDKLANEALVVIEDFGVESPRSSALRKVLDNLGAVGKKALVITSETDETVALAGRNLDGVSVINADNINVLDMLNHELLVTTPDVLKKVEATYQ